MQRTRFEREYLLGELAARRFLPGYGFPTDIVPFVFDTASTAGRSRDDNRFSVRDFPSRQLDIAIRDYAPGSEVVLDGLVHESAGVTLNWQRPAGDNDVREIQSLRYAWRCRNCGTTDTTFGLPEICFACGGASLDRLPYLRPAGFVVDIRKKPHTDVNHVHFIKPTRPWISARRGFWTSLPAPEVGRFRSTRDGHVFHYSRGSAGHGYALCLECGRAVEERQDDAGAKPLPSLMRNHRPLRGVTGADGVCGGIEKPFAVRRNLMLGHDITTDVFELQLSGLDDESAAVSLAVALREALSRLLGIEPQELGWTTIRSLGSVGQAFFSILLFDRAAGGAGFASQAPEDMAGLLPAAADILECRNPTCVNGCHACILTGDSQFEADLLDRRRALKFLREGVLPHLRLPAERRYLGNESWAESRPLIEALDRTLHAHGTAQLIVWLGEHPSDWDLAMWTARPLLEKWGGRGSEPRIAVPHSTLALMDPEQRVTLARVVDRCPAPHLLQSKTCRVSRGPGALLMSQSIVASLLGWLTNPDTWRGTSRGAFPKVFRSSQGEPPRPRR